MFFLLMRRVQPYKLPIQLFAGCCAFALGLWGWYIRSLEEGVVDWFNIFFRTIQLVALNFPVAPGSLPWQLQFARLALPMVALFAAFSALMSAARAPARKATLPFARDHVVVLGVERLADSALRRLVAYRDRLIVVARFFEDSRQRRLDLLRIKTFEADMDASSTLRSLNLKHATALFLMSRDSMANLDLTAKALLGMDRHATRGAPLSVVVNAGREEFGAEIARSLDGLARSTGVRFRRFNPDRESLRIELARMPQTGSILPGEKSSRVLVIGLAGDWEDALMQLLSMLQRHADARPSISLLLGAADAASFERFRLLHPDLNLLADFDVTPCEDLAMFDRAPPARWTSSPAPDLALVMLPDAEAIAAALLLRRPGNALCAESCPILIRRDTEDELLEALGETDIRYRDLTRIASFGGLVRAETIDRVVNPAHDELAVALHRHYASAALANGVATVASWDELTENLRDANRAAMDHAPILLASEGIRIVRAVAGAPAVELTDAELDRLARIEHRRWCADRIDHGWRGGPERDDRHLIHDNLVPFEQLSPADQEKDRASVRAILQSLGLASRMAVREQYVVVECAGDSAGALSGDRVAASLRELRKDRGALGVAIVAMLNAVDEAPTLARAVADTDWPLWLLHRMSLNDAFSDPDPAARRATRTLVLRAESCSRLSPGDAAPSPWRRLEVRCLNEEAPAASGRKHR